MASVSFDNVNKIYPDGFHAVKNFNLDIKDKEFIIFVGPSGCGKSTTMRMLAGLEDANEGVLKIDGRTVNGLPPKDRNIAMVFQDYALYPHMTVEQNMSLSLKLKKCPKHEIKEKVSEAADILELTEMLNKYPGQLSGGQRQRVALGRAIVRNPDVFLFDEPLSNLDPKLRTTMRVEIKKLHQNLDSTMIYVTHDQIEAMTLGDRIVVMNEGVIQQVDTPIELYNNPINTFVAGFIGSPHMNFFEGEIVSNNSNTYFKGQGFQLLLSDNVSQSINNKNFAGAPQVILGVRPENIIISDATGSPESSFEAVVDVIEPVGSDYFIHMYIQQNNNEDKSFDKSMFVLEHPSQDLSDLKVSDEIQISFNMNKVHYFNTINREIIQ